VTIHRSLVRQYTLFSVGLTAIVSAGSFLITNHVTRTGLEDLFRQRLVQAEDVLRQYTRVNHLARVSQLETALTSPRLLAALETGDPATVEAEVPTHGSLVDSGFIVIWAADDAHLFSTEGLPAELEAIAIERAREAIDATEVENVEWNGQIYELVQAKVTANNGRVLGTVVSGRSLAAAYGEDLKRLTGFDVVLGLGGRVVSGSSPEGVEAGSSAIELEAGRVTRVEVEDTTFLASRVEDPVSGMSVIFLASIDEPIAPVMNRVRVLLLVLAVAGSIVAVLVVWLFTRARVSRQVQQLVHYAERIGQGDLGFTIRSRSDDELGHLAGKVEEMRSRLEQNRRELEKAQRDKLDVERLAALGRIATGIVHDFKNPVAIVRGTADRIESRDPENEKLAKQCRVINRQVDRMTALARDVLEYAKGHSVLDVETIDLATWLEEIAASHAEPLRRAGVKLALQGPRGMQVMFDPERMRRVIDNIVNNAREVSSVGDTITFRWSRWEESDIRIEVADEGPGIPPELGDRLFDPFVTGSKEGGSGLGLAIARKIVEDHGARLDVESTPGGGATFVVRLPEKLHVTPERKPQAEKVTS
jgi:signal transduction histidine kinase